MLGSNKSIAGGLGQNPLSRDPSRGPDAQVFRASCSRGDEEGPRRPENLEPRSSRREVRRLGVNQPRSKWVPGPLLGFKRISFSSCVQPWRRGGPPKAKKPRTSILEVRTPKIDLTSKTPKNGRRRPELWAESLPSSRRGSDREPRRPRFEAFWPSGALLVATAGRSSKNRCV